MSSPSLLPTEEQGGVDKLKIDKTLDAKDKKGTLTNLFKKSQELAAKAAAEPEVVELLDDSQEGDQPLPEGMTDVTPAAPEDKEAEVQVTEEKPNAMEVVEPAADEAQPAEDNSGDQSDKKRKRPAKTQDQLTALEALYATDRYPSTEAKRECGAKIGLEVKEVSKWLESRRRKDTRAASKKSRSDAAVRGSACEPVTNAAEAAPEAVPEQEQANTQAKKRIVPTEDVEMVDVAPSAQEPTSATAIPAATTVPEEKAAVAAAPATTTAKTSAISTLPDMKEIAKMIENLSSEADILRQRGLAAPLTAIPAAGTSPEPFTDTRLAAFIVGQQMPLTELTATLHPLFGPPAGALEGAAGQVLTVEALRTRILDLAVRKSYDPVDNPKGAPPRLDASEAVPKDGRPSMWQWELRDSKILPKAQRSAAAAIKRRAGRVGDRLTAVINAYEALVKVSAGLLTSSKASKTVDALKKYDTLEQMDACQAAGQAAAAAKEAEKASQAALSLEEKKRAAALILEEKKRIAAEKEAEKERLRQEKEAEKEQARKEREAEKEKKLKEAEAAKLAKMTGFKDKEVLNKTANKFMSFFKAGAGGTAGAGKSSSVSPLGTAAPSPAAGGAIIPPGSVAGAATATAPAPLSAYERRFPRPPPDNLVPQPVQPLSIAKIDAALSAATISDEAAVADFKSFLASAATARRAAAAAPPSGIGLPPSWARRPGAIEAASERLRHMKDAGVDPNAVRTWRRKLIWFSGDSMRPPYYGSWPKPGPTITARRYLGKDETLDYEVMSDLDWEEEPEGSSLSGADDEDDGPAAGEESEVEDSFMVADGYLSEDEGVRLDDDMDVDSGEVEEQMRLLHAATAAAAGGSGDGGSVGGIGNAIAAGANDAVRTRASQAMQVLLDRARRSGKPLVIVRQDVADAAANAAAGDATAANAAPDGCVVYGDSAALEALAMEVLIPGISFIPPQDPALANENVTAAGAAAGATGAPKTSKRGGMLDLPPGQFRYPEDLVPDLASFIMQNTSMLKSAMVDAFIAAHPERKITKKWVGEKITELAERSGNKWTLRPAALDNGGAPLAGAEATPAPAAAATGPLGRLLVKSHAGTTSKPTPAVPSALRPAVPASNLKAPERLVTTTAAGEAQAQAHAAATAALQQPLIVPETVDGTGDDFWTLLLQHIEAETSISGVSNEPTFTPAFKPDVLSRSIHALPAFILDALLMTVHRNSNSDNIGKKKLVLAAVHSLRVTVDALAHLERSLPGDDATPSQKAWGDARSGSHSASLAGLCREPALIEVLKSSISGSLGSKAEEDGVAMVPVLLGCPAFKEISAENAAAVRSSLEKAVKNEQLHAWKAVFKN